MCQRPRCGCVLRRNLAIACATSAATIVIALVAALLTALIPPLTAAAVAIVTTTAVIASGYGAAFRRRQNAALRRLRQSPPSVPVVITGRRGARLAAQIAMTQPPMLSIPLPGEAARPIVAVATRVPRS